MSQIKSNGGGEFIIKRWVVIVSFIVMLVSIGYSFAMTFEIGPIKDRLAKVEGITESNHSTCQKIEIHFEYIRSELDKIAKKVE